MSRTRRPRRCASPARRAPTRSPASPPASPACGARPMAAPTRRRSTCCARSARPKRIPEYIARAKDKNDPFRLMGFGHRVYKNFDPRAKVMKKTAEEVLKELGISDPVLRRRPGARADRAQGRIFHREEALSERRFLFGRDPVGDRLPDRHVHRAVRARPHRRLGRAVERDDLRPRPEDRPPAPALHRRDRSATTCRSTSARRPLKRSAGSA